DDRKRTGPSKAEFVGSCPRLRAGLPSRSALGTNGVGKFPYNRGVKEPVRPVPLLPARWPTRAEAEGSRWFSPLKLGKIEARARTWVPAMVPWRATDEGFVTEDVLDWYGRFA